MITKKQEIELFEKFIEGLPTESYLFDWLSEVKQDVIRTILDDFPCDISLKEHRKEIEAASKEVKELKAIAEKLSSDIKELRKLERTAAGSAFRSIGIMQDVEGMLEKSKNNLSWDIKGFEKAIKEIHE